MAEPDIEPNISADWYRERAARYAEVASRMEQSVWTVRSHPKLTDEMAAFERLKELVETGARGLDAGCGAGARDVHLLGLAGFDMIGVDVVPENIEVSKQLHPELADRVSVADLGEPLPFADASFDFAMCESVFQHMDDHAVFEVCLPELARVVRPGGILQLLFKRGEGTVTILDPEYNAGRSFRLYDEADVLAALDKHGVTLIEADTPDELGGLLYVQDHREIPMCLMWCRKG